MNFFLFTQAGLVADPCLVAQAVLCQLPVAFIRFLDLFGFFRGLDLVLTVASQSSGSGTQPLRSRDN